MKKIWVARNSLAKMDNFKKKKKYIKRSCNISISEKKVAKWGLESAREQKRLWEISVAKSHLLL